MELKVGMLCKHFKGTNLIEKNIYEILAINVNYTGDNDLDLSSLVIYRPLFQDGKFFAREYDDLVKELSIEEKQLYGQNYRVEPLSNEEIALLDDQDFIRQKIDYIESKYQKKRI